MSTEFENNSFEKNAITSGKPVARWGDSKSCISGVFNPVKLTFSQTIIDVVYSRLNKRNGKNGKKLFY